MYIGPLRIKQGSNDKNVQLTSRCSKCRFGKVGFYGKPWNGLSGCGGHKSTIPAATYWYRGPMDNNNTKCLRYATAGEDFFPKNFCQMFSPEFYKSWLSRARINHDSKKLEANDFPLLCQNFTGVFGVKGVVQQCRREKNCFWSVLRVFLLQITWVRNKMPVNEASFKDNGGNDHLFLHPVHIVIYPRLLWHFHCWFGCGYLASKWMTNEKTHTRWASMIAINWVISPCKWPTGVKKTLLIGGYNPICNLEPASSEFATFLGGEQFSQINSR